MVLSFFPASAFADEEFAEDPMEISEAVPEVNEEAEEPVQEEPAEENDENPPAEAFTDEGVGETEEPSSDEEPAAPADDAAAADDAALVEEVVEEEEEEEVIVEEVVAETQTVTEEAMDATYPVQAVDADDNPVKLYDDLQAAVNEDLTGIIKLIGDITLPKALEVGVDVELRAAETTITGDVTVNSGISFTMKGGTINGSLTTAGNATLGSVTIERDLKTSGDTTLKNVTVKAQNNTVVVNGGTLHIPFEDGGSYGTVVYYAGTGFVKGGSFTYIPDTLLAKGYELKNGKVEKYDAAAVAKIDNRGYSTIANALGAYKDRDVIILLNDGTAEFTKVGTFIFDKNDSTLTARVSATDPTIYLVNANPNPNSDGTYTYEVKSYLARTEKRDNAIINFYPTVAEAIAALKTDTDADHIFIQGAAPSLTRETAIKINDTVTIREATDHNIVKNVTIVSSDASKCVQEDKAEHVGQVVTYSLADLSEFECTLDGIPYDSFLTALSAATNGQTITLQKNVTLLNGASFGAKTLTIDLNDKTLTTNDELKVAYNSDLTIKNGKLNGVNVGWSGVFVAPEEISDNFYSLTLDDVVVTTSNVVGFVCFDSNGSKLTIKNSTLNLDACNYYVFYTQGTHITVDNSTITVTNVNSRATVDSWNWAFMYEAVWNIKNNSVIDLQELPAHAFQNFVGTISDSTVRMETQQEAIVQNDVGAFQSEANTLTITNSTLDITTGVGYNAFVNGTTDQPQKNNSEVLISIDGQSTISDTSGLIAKANGVMYGSFNAAATAAKANESVVNLLETPAATDSYNLTSGVLKVKLNDKAVATDIVKAEGDNYVVASEPDAEGVVTCSLAHKFINVSKMEGGLVVPVSWHDTINEAYAACGAEQFIGITADVSYEFALTGPRTIYLYAPQGVNFTYTTPNGYHIVTSPDSTTASTCYKLVADTFTIAFDKGTGDSGTTLSVEATYGSTATLTENGFVKTGYHFGVWYDQADATYTDKEVLTVEKVNALYEQRDRSNTVTLTADWTPNEYTITFRPNGGTGTNPPDVTATYDDPDGFVLPENPYVREGYTFSGWSINGTVYQAGVTVTDNLTTVDGRTLYAMAQWTPVTFNITFVGNGSDGGSMTDMVNISYEPADPQVPLTANAFTKTGYSFTRWTVTEEDNPGANFVDQEELGQIGLTYLYENAVKVEGTLTATLYAQWTPITYTVAFDGNGGTGTTNSVNMTYDTPATLTKNAFKNTGYAFDKWNTQADGKGVSYLDQQEVNNLTSVAGSTVTLYAQWTHEAALYDGSMQGTPYATVAAAKTAFEKATEGKYRGIHIEKDGVSYGLAWNDTIKVLKNGHEDFEVVPKTAGTDPGPFYIVPNGPDANGVITYTTALCVASVTTVPYEQKYVDFELKWVPKAETEWTTDTFDTFANAATAALDRTGLGEHDQKFITLLTKNTVPYELGEDNQLLINANGQNPNLKSYAEDKKIVNTAFADIAGVKLYSYEQLYFVTFTSEGEEFAPTQAKIFGEKAKRPATDPTKEGYTFDNWYTKDAQDEYTAVYDFAAPVTANVNLFAKFTPNTYSIKFNKNNTKALGTMENQEFSYDAEQNLTANAFTLTGQHFLGWALSNRGEVVYADEAAVENLASAQEAVVNLYAKWSPNDYTVTFHANNGVDPEEITTKNFTYDPATGAEGTPLNANSFTKYGFTFTGWKDGDGVSYKNKEKVNFPVENNGNVDLYAQWKEASFKLAFDANGGAGTAMKAQTVTYNKDATLNANTYTRAGYDFQGWALSAEAEEAAYADQAELTVLQVNELFEYGQGKTVTLYAVWTPHVYKLEYVGVTEEYQAQAVKSYNVAAIPEDGIAIEDPTKTGYTFDGWTLVITDGAVVKTIENVKNNMIPHDVTKIILGDRVYTANWTAVDYTLKFDAKGGKVVDPVTQKAVSSYTVQNVHYDGAVVWPEDPTRTGYSFAGWDAYVTGTGTGEDNPKVPVTVPFDTMPAANVTVEATWTVNQYTLTFYDTNPDGTPIEPPFKITQDYNTAVTAPKDPTKTHYSFVKWVDKDGKAVTVPTKMPAENRDYFATWIGDPVTIIWHDDNELLWNNTDQRYGDKTVPAEKVRPKILTRTKPGFALDPADLWDPSVSEYVEGNAFYNLNWKPVFTVEFILDGRIISKIPVTKGLTIPADKEPTAEEGGKQAKWLINGEIDNFFEFNETVVNGDMRLVASWTAPITFLDGDGNELLTKVYPYDEKPEYAGPTPTKEPTEQYSYTWTGEWDPAIVEVSGSATYTATFKETVKEYTITWKDGNGDVLKTDTLAYDAMPKYTGDTPTKEATAQYSYTWTGEWDPALEEVKGDATYTATFTETVNEYTITWKDGNDEVLKTDTLAYGVMPEYTGDTPTKDATAQYTYTFNGKWLPEFTAVSEDATYTAQFDETVNKYKVTFMDGEKKYFEKDVDYGSTVEQPKDPITTQVGVTFGGWFAEGSATEFDFENTPITANLTLTAKWNPLVAEYTVTFDADGGEPVPAKQTVKEGEKAVKPDDPTKDSSIFLGWFEEGSETAFDFNTPITSNKTLKAKWQLYVTAQSYSIALAGKIGVSFYVVIPEELIAAGITPEVFSEGLDVEVENFAPVTREGFPANTYEVTTSVYAKHDQRQVSLRFFLGNELVPMYNGKQEHMEGDAYVHSVYDYLMAIKDMGGKLGDLGRAMRNYCESVRKYFNIDSEIPYDITEVQPDAQALAPYKAVIPQNLPDGLSYYAIALAVQSDTKLQVYFQVASGHNIGEYTFMIDGSEVTPVQQGNFYYIESAPISAKDLDTVKDIRVNGVAFSNVSALSYATNVINSTTTDASLKQVAMTIYNYNQAANAYFGA
jgi:uncharacterized repeat protein (TIGR02543 family)